MSKNIIAIAQQRLNSPEGLPKSLDELTAAIIELYSGGKSQRDIATLYGISQGYVSKVLKKHKVPTRKPELAKYYSIE